MDHLRRDFRVGTAVGLEKNRMIGFIVGSLSTSSSAQEVRAGMQDRATATRARLITAAAQLINDVGLESASVDKISCRALVSKGAFYFHFPSKDHLLGALIAAPSPSPKLRCK